MGPRLRCCERPTAIPAVVARDEFLTGRSHMWHPPSALTMRRQRAVEGLHQDALISSRVQERLATPRARRGTGRRGSCQSASGSLRSDPPLSHQRTPVQVFEHRPGHLDQVPLYLMSCNAGCGGLPAIVGRSGAYPAMRTALGLLAQVQSPRGRGYLQTLRSVLARQSRSPIVREFLDEFDEASSPV